MDQSTIKELLEKVNGHIEPFKLAWVNFETDCDLAQVNARFMEKETLDRLSQNIKRDGALSQIPFANWDGERFVICSGNNRLKAALRAGQKHGLLLYAENLEDDRFRAIQLSHNALVGKDDKDILRQIFKEIKDLELVEYSGIDETLFKDCEPPAMPTINDDDLQVRELTLQFFPGERVEADQVIESLQKVKIELEDQLLVGFHLEEMIEVMTRIQKTTKIKNTTVAFLKMLEICNGWLEAQTQEEPEG